MTPESQFTMVESPIRLAGDIKIAGDRDRDCRHIDSE